MKVKYLVLGAGISGISFVEQKFSEDYLILEQKTEKGATVAAQLETVMCGIMPDIFFIFRMRN